MKNQNIDDNFKKIKIVIRNFHWKNKQLNETIKIAEEFSKNIYIRPIILNISEKKNN